MAIQPSAELIRAIWNYNNGDRKAFGEIYRLSRPYLAKCAANVVNRMAPGASQDLIEDVLQESFLTVAEKLHTLQNEEAYFQWAGQIVTNHALRIWKKESWNWNMERLEDDMDYEETDERFIPADILESREKQQLIRNMLQELPNGQYMCLVEYFYNGLKEREIAEKLEMPLGTVKTNLSRAKKKLKDIVQTHEKKNGVKLYSMSWLLLVLFWDDIKAVFTASGVAKSAAVLVVEEAPAVYVAAAGAAGGASAAAAVGGASVAAGGAAAAAGGTAAGVAGGVAAAGAGIGTKIIAGTVAAALAVTIGGTAAVVLPQKESANSREFVRLGHMDWDNLPELTPVNVATIENAFGDLKPGRAAKGEVIRVDALPDDHEDIPDGVLCNVEYVDNETLVLSGENADGQRMEVTVNCDGDNWEIQSAQETEYAKSLYPINDAMRQKGFPAVLYGWQIADEYGLAHGGAFCMGMMYWKEKLGHTNFSVTGVGQSAEWQIPHLGEPGIYDPENDGPMNDITWDAVWIHRETLEFHHDPELVTPYAPPEVAQKLGVEIEPEPNPEPAVPEVTEPVPTEPEETKPAAVQTRYGDVVLSAEELDYFNKLVRNIYLPAPATGPATPYKQGSEWMPAEQFITGCAGENGLLKGRKTSEGLVVSKADVTNFLLDTLGWEAPYNVDKYAGILDNGNDTYLIPTYGGDKTDIGINDIYVVTADKILVYVPRDHTSYHCLFQRNADSPYGWTLMYIQDNEKAAAMGNVMALGLFERGIVAPAEGPALTDGSYGRELSMGAAEAYVRHYVWKTTGKRPSKVTVEDWGLVANSYYTYKVTVGDTNQVYLIGTSDAALAEYHGPDVARSWFEWELVE